MDDFRRPAPTRRDYTVPDRPARPPVNPTPPPTQDTLIEHPRVRPAKKRSKKPLIIISSVVLLAGMVVGAWQGYGYYQDRKISSQIPASVRADLKIPVYIPNKPELAPTKQSIDYSNGVFSFTTGSGDNRLTYTQQPRPADFSLSNFANKGVEISDVKQDSVNGNDVLIGLVGGNRIAIMDTGDTIITITGNANQTSKNMLSVLQSMQKG